MTDTPSVSPAGDPLLATPATRASEGYAAPPGERHTESSGAPGDAGATCPSCGTPYEVGSAFCEACGADLPAATSRDDDVADEGPLVAAATPQTAAAGEESPLDVGWTGVVAGEPGSAPDQTCPACGEGKIVDGYCDRCGTPPPDPRDHVTQAPASWVGGVCDIGRRHSRNEDAMALTATEPPGSRAALVVCDGVSMAADSHIASLAAAETARCVLGQPLPRGVGTPDTLAAAARQALTRAAAAANEAVRETVRDDVPNPPSCTFAAALVEDGLVVAGNVGDSRAYWLPDAADEAPRQLGQDDSFANEQMLAGMSRADAEGGPNAHAITRWLGRDAPDDLTPHMSTVRVTGPGWLLVCSDGLWNYESEATELRELLRKSALRVGEEPVGLAQALVDFANDRGGRDNITVALARLAGQGSMTSSGAAVTIAPEEGERADG